MSTKHKQGSEGWHRARGGLVTASNVAACFGKHPFKRAADLAKLLRQDPANRDRCKSLAMNWGTRFEDVAKRHYEEAVNVRVDDTGFWNMMNPPLLEHRRAPPPVFCGGSPDGIVSFCDGEEGSGIIEIKSPHSRSMPAPLVKNMMHVFQMTTNMFCTGSTWSHFISYTPMGISVEFFPRPDQVSLGVLDALHHGEQESWTKKGVFDPATGKYIGYGRVFFQVLYNFYCAAQKQQRQFDRHFAFDNYENIRLVNEVHEALKEGGHITTIYESAFAIPVPPKLVRAKVQWTAMMMWQMKHILTNNECKNKAPWLFRFASVTKGTPRAITHAMDMQNMVQKPAWFHMSAMCVDIVYTNRRGAVRCKELTLDGASTTTQKVNYFQREDKVLPSAGTAVVTLLNNGYITQHRVVPWELRLGDDMSATTFIPIQVLPTVQVHVDCMHRHVTLVTVAASAAAAKPPQPPTAAQRASSSSSVGTTSN